MRRLEHAIIGMGFGAAAAHVTGGDLWLSMGVAAVGASIPDVDLKWADRWDRPRSGSPCRLLDHRGPTHSLAAVVLAGVVVGLAVHPYIGLVLALGWLSHIAADAVSPFGEPYLWPLSARRYRLLPYRLRVRSGTPWVDFPIAALVFWIGLYVHA